MPMNLMNLSVVFKIIGGFTIVSTLMVVTSVFSLSSLDTIEMSTVEVREIAIPTLTDSNQLMVQLTQMGNLTLRAFYQQNLAPLEENRLAFASADDKFNVVLKKLAKLVQHQPDSRSNLKKIDKVHLTFTENVNNVFQSRRTAIAQGNLLNERVSELEEKADDAATLILDLGDHDLADTKLQTAIEISEQIENLLNAIVSSALEYRDTLDQKTTGFIEREITNAANDLNQALVDINNELNQQGVSDIAEEISESIDPVSVLISSEQGIFNNKNQQLSSIAQGDLNLIHVDKNIDTANLMLYKQVGLANKTSDKANDMVVASVSDGTRLTLFIMLASIAISVIIARVTLISITRPLARVNDMLRIVASGDLSHKLDASGKDEFAVLSNNCNSLIDSLRNLIDSIVSRSAQLSTAAEQTSTVTNQSTSAILEQRNQVEQAASATTQMSSTSQTVLSSAKDALDEIKQADDEAERVKGISQTNRATIEALANEVESASQVINKLQQDSASIGGILEVIRGIADQTNLLALNAAIEAARAGEQGRGFAVVADEVRTLASRTQHSTQEISQMIEALQSGSEKAVAVMDNGKKQAINCVEQSELADKALDTITHAVHEAFDRSSQIATAAQQQSEVAHEISANLESIVSLAEKTTLGSQQTATSSSEVARLAEELQQSVQEFKL
jgi:methyl-accepting chemotaxis protein